MKSFITGLFILALATCLTAQKSGGSAYSLNVGEDLFTGIYNSYYRALDTAAHRVPPLKKGEWRMWSSTLQTISPDSNLTMQLVTARNYKVAVSKDTIIIYGDGKTQILPVMESPEPARYGDYYSYQTFAGVTYPNGMFYRAQYSELARRLSLNLMWYDLSTGAKKECWTNITFCFSNACEALVITSNAKEVSRILVKANEKTSGESLAGTK